MSDFDAVVLRDAAEWQHNTVRLLVRQRQGNYFTYIKADVLLQTVAEGEAVDGAGIELPAGAIEAIAEAIAAFQGDAGHAATEARVLREWLAVERARVDSLLVRGPA